MTTMYPLDWPAGWPRTRPADRLDGRRTFLRSAGRSWTFAAARDALYEEAARLGSPSWNTVISTDFQLNQRGEPSLSKGRPSDNGVAIYLRRVGRPYVMACDRYERAEENMRSLALAIEAMRQLERHGGGVMMERAFQGFAAIAAPAPQHWTAVLGLPATATRADIEAAFRRLARERHPDAGGSDAMMAALNAARDQALKERRS